MEPTDMQSQLKQQLDTYHPSTTTIQLIQETPILLLVGISGAGKGTITQELLKTGKYHLIISHTTRQPRANNGVMEQDGREYHFVTIEQSLEMLKAGAYVEANMYAGNVYGTSAAEIQAAHDTKKIALADIEVQGVANYMSINPKITAVYVVPPSYDVWQERFKKRYVDEPNQADFAKRMATSERELAQALAAPYFTFVLNDDLDTAVATVDHIAGGGALETQQAAAAREIAVRIHAQLATQAAA